LIDAGQTIMSNHSARCIAGTLGFAGVLFGAFGAHILRQLLQKFGTTEIWQTGVLYNLVHAVALLALSGWRPVPSRAFNLILGGVIIFSGSLYLLALTNVRWLGAVTPIGGLGMLSGWLVLIFSKREET
jgi:uncharacterized membrane protein YgdD (TMEM256/DUF423 family)